MQRFSLLFLGSILWGTVIPCLGHAQVPPCPVPPLSDLPGQFQRRGVLANPDPPPTPMPGSDRVVVLEREPPEFDCLSSLKRRTDPAKKVTIFLETDESLTGNIMHVDLDRDVIEFCEAGDCNGGLRFFDSQDVVEVQWSTPTTIPTVALILTGLTLSITSWIDLFGSFYHLFDDEAEELNIYPSRWLAGAAFLVSTGPTFAAMHHSGYNRWSCPSDAP